jgi:hypothetical protein
MRRDLDLIRTILVEIEEHATFGKFVRLQAAGYSPEQVSYYVKLLHDAGLIEANNFSTLGRLDWRPKSLT